jgi:hypothetical protein
MFFINQISPREHTSASPWTISVISSLVIEGKTSSLSFLEPPIFLLSFLTPLLQLLYLKMKCKEKRKNSYQKEIRQLQDLIRHKGNNQHNERVQRAEQGEIFLSRRKQTQDFQVDDYGLKERHLLSAFWSHL